MSAKKAIGADTEKEIARFFDCCETPGQRKANTRFSRRARRELIQGLNDLGIEGKTVLEVGSGPGELTRKLVKLGASRALGIDLAEKTLQEARKNAEDEQLSDKIEYRIGNGAKQILVPHDIVVLDKVICCYPDWRELVGNTSAAAQSTFGFVIPRSKGPMSWLVRGFLAIGNVFMKLKKCGFTPFVHDYSKIHAHLEEQGLRRTHLSDGLVWMTAVYSRD